MMTHLFSTIRRRDGLTLIELMVAIAIISILAAISLPSVKNSLREQKVTRSASLVQSAIEEGRARAIGQGGGGGVIIDRIGSGSLTERCEATRIRFARLLPNYTGDGGNERCRVIVTYMNNNPVSSDTIRLQFSTSSAQLIRSADDIAAGTTDTLIPVGSTVLLGDAGYPLRIDSIVRNPTTGTLVSIDVGVTRIELNQDLRRFHNQFVSFQIIRSPSPAIAMPISTIKGTSIDLTSSGLGRYGNEFSPMFIDGNYLATTANPFLSGTRDYQSIWILFGARGEVSRVLLGNSATPPALVNLPVTGDIHLLVGRGGQVKTLPDEQLEDGDPDPLLDEAKDGKTPLLDSESIWVTIRSRTGEVISSPWTDPTDDTTYLVPGHGTTPGTDAQQQTRIQTVIGRTRAAAIASRDQGAL